MQPDQSQIEELKQLIAAAEGIADEAVSATGKRIATCCEIGKRILELRGAVGLKAWQEWRDANLPEAASLERGSIKLHQIKEKQPDLFNEQNMVRLARYAGVLPATVAKKAAPRPLLFILRGLVDRLTRALCSAVENDADIVHSQTLRSSLQQLAMCLQKFKIT